MYTRDIRNRVSHSSLLPEDTAIFGKRLEQYMKYMINRFPLARVWYMHMAPVMPADAHNKRSCK